MKERHVIITNGNGDTGVLVGFTQGCAIVILDNNGKFVKVEIDNLVSLCND